MMETDLKPLVCRLYEQRQQHLTVPTRDHVLRAGWLVERLFPPKDAEMAFCLLTALNLLNAAVKMPWGRRMVSYNFVKGYAAMLYIYLNYCPVEGVTCYLDIEDDVTYFRALGVQISFHYVPRYNEVRRFALGQRDDAVQTWDGMLLQQIAVPLFLLANGEGDAVQMPYDDDRLPYRLLHFERPRLELPDGCLVAPVYEVSAEEVATAVDSQPEGKKPRVRVPTAREQRCRRRMAAVTVKPFAGRTLIFRGRSHAERKRLRALGEALAPSVWLRSDDSFCLYRRRDHLRVPVMRYTGHNYQELVNFLVSNRNLPWLRSRKSLQVGKFYYLSPAMRLKSVRPSTRLAFLTHNNYLLRGRHRYCLCVTYGIARYLALLYPDLLFVNILSYNRYKNKHRRYYTYSRLLKVPLHSRARSMKVWVVHDRFGTLRQFNPETLPEALIDEYLATDDYYREYEVTTRNGLHGLYAHKWHHLLPPVYAAVVVLHFSAHVQDTNGKWAIYSLMSEEFCTEFLYDNIWYDRQQFAVMGLCWGVTVKLYDFFPGMF